jgi:hypothetical protein
MSASDMTGSGTRIDDMASLQGTWCVWNSTHEKDTQAQAHGWTTWPACRAHSVLWNGITPGWDLRCIQGCSIVLSGPVRQS